MEQQGTAGSGGFQEQYQPSTVTVIPTQQVSRMQDSAFYLVKVLFVW